MPEQVTALLRAYRHFACHGYRDAALLGLAALALELGHHAFAEAALTVFEEDREFYGEDAEVLAAVWAALRQGEEDSCAAA